jgi:hypothetical protein
MEITFTDEELQLLLEVLEEQHRELLHEISRTDHHEFRMLLRNKEKVLESMLDKLARRVCA